MPFKEAAFWVFLTVFGTGLYFFYEPSHSIIPALSLTAVGLVGMGLLVFQHHYPNTKLLSHNLLVWFGLLLTWCFLGYAVYISGRNPQGYNFQHPLAQDTPRSVAKTLNIALVKTGAAAFEDVPAPNFPGDHLYELQQEHGDGVFGILTSVELGHYQHFWWVISVAGDFQSDFALSARAAYVTSVAGKPVSFSPLNFTGRQGPPYREIAVEVPSAEKGQQIMIAFSIYPIRPQAKFLNDIGRMLTTGVE